MKRRSDLFVGARRAVSLLSVALILLLAAALRAVNLGGRALWYDEAFSVLFAEAGPDAMLEGTLAHDGDGEAAAEEHPPLYYFALSPWIRLAGRSPEAVRAFSLLAGVLTVAVIYRLAADLFGHRAGLAAALTSALAPFPVQYAQEARMYALMALWLALATWCFVRGGAWRAMPLQKDRRGRAGAQRAVPLQKDSRGRAGAQRAMPLQKNQQGRVGARHAVPPYWWAGFAVCAALSVYTQQLAAFYLVALALFPAVLRRWDVFRRVAAAGVAALALYLPWMLQLPAQLGKLQEFWLESPGPAQAMQTLFGLAVPLIDLPAWVYMSGLLVAMFLVALLAVHGWRWRRLAGERLGLVIWLAFVPAALMFVVGQFLPVYLLRALLPSALMFYVGVGWLFARGRVPRPVLGGIAALWLVVGGAGLAQHYTLATFPNGPFDRAADYLSEAYAPGDVIIHSNKITFLPMVYYDADLPQVFIADPPGSRQDTLAPATQQTLGVREQARPNIQAAAAGRERVWFVVFERELDENAGARADLDWLQAHFAQTGPARFNDLHVYLFAGSGGQP